MRDCRRIHVCGALQECYGTQLTYAVRSRRYISAYEYQIALSLHAAIGAIR
jgi:hypothetical protein